MNTRNFSVTTFFLRGKRNNENADKVDYLVRFITFSHSFFQKKRKSLIFGVQNEFSWELTKKVRHEEISKRNRMINLKKWPDLISYLNWYPKVHLPNPLTKSVAKPTNFGKFWDENKFYVFFLLFLFGSLTLTQQEIHQNP